MNPASVPGTIVQEISIHAPVERVFQALTNPEQRMKWWGAEGRFQVKQFESRRKMVDARDRNGRQALHRSR